MYGAMSTAASGLRHLQLRIDVIADNMANINTIAFKSRRIDFKDALYTAGISQAGAPYTPNGSQQKGNGMLVSQITTNWTRGEIMHTGEKLDLYVDGDVFLSVRTSTGEVKYTKAANNYVIVSDAEGSLHLKTSNGHFVLDNEGNVINPPPNAEDIVITQSGQIRFVVDGTEYPGPTLGVYGFINIYGLSYEGDSLFSPTAASGEAYLADEDEFSLFQGELEMSNTIIGEEIQIMLRTSRAFQMSARALTTGDQMEGLANSMRQ